MKNIKKIILALVIGIYFASSVHMNATSPFSCKSSASFACETITDSNSNIILCHDDSDGHTGG